MTTHRYDRVVPYNKLVRDGIPGHIAAQGKPYKVHVAGEAEYRQKLQHKLKEEVAEYCAAPGPDDLADILEVIYALAALHGLDRAAVEVARATKAQARGGFSRRIILEES